MDLDLDIECLEQIIYCNEELHRALLDNDYKKALLVLKAELIREEEYLSYIKDLVSSSFETTSLPSVWSYEMPIESFSVSFVAKRNFP